MKLRFKRAAVPVSAVHVSVISVEQQQRVVAELRRVEHGTVAEQMAVVDWASQYANSYYRTARGELRKVFPNAKKLRRAHAGS